MHKTDGSKTASRAWSKTVVASSVLGLASTVGDWIWARFLADGAILPAIVHGLLFFALIALVLGWAAGSGRALRRLLLSLPPTGLVLAAVFYPLAGVLGYLGALLATWVGMWLSLALLERWAGGSRRTLTGGIRRGLLAAVTSGIAFWLVSGMWTRPELDLTYPLRFLAWTFAFLPGIASLLLPGSRRVAE